MPDTALVYALLLSAKTEPNRKKHKKEPAWTSSSPADDNFHNTSAVFLEETKVIRKQKSIKTEREHSDESDFEPNDSEEYECQVEAVYGTDQDDDDDDEDPIETNAAAITMKFEMDSENDKEDEDEEYSVSDSSESSDKAPLRRKTRGYTKTLRTKRGRPRRKRRNFYSEMKSEKKIRRPKPVTCKEKCKKQCTKIDEDQRKKLCKEFWALGFLERKNYLLANVERKPLGKMRRLHRKKESRQHTNHYFMKTNDGERVRVCLDFFLKTYAISNYLVKDAQENSDGKGNYTGTDLRGGSGEGRRLKTELARQQRENSNEEVEPPNDDIPRDPDGETSENKAESGNGEVKPLTKEVPTDQKELEEEINAEPTTPGDVKAIAIDSNKHKESLATLHTEITEPLQQPTTTPVKPKPPKPKQPSRKRGTVKERMPQTVNCAESCRFKCHTKFTEEQRVLLCAAFWRLSFKRRKDFVLSRVEAHENTTTTAAEHRKTNRVRVFTNRYFLRGEKGENVRVCSRFFNATLCIGNHFLANAQRNVDKQTGAYAGEDRRGRNPCKNKIPDEIIAGAREHISSYPTWVPHKNYKTRFLHSSLNIVKMYSEYKEECERRNRPAISGSFFRKVFHKDFKLAFLQPTSKHAHKVSSQRKNIPSATTTTFNSGVSNTATAEGHTENAFAVCSTSATTTSAPKKNNPNISTFTGEEGGFWTQLTPNATETMRFLQQRYAPQVSAPVIVQTIIHQQQQQQQQQLQLAQQQTTPTPLPLQLPLQQQLLQQQQLQQQQLQQQQLQLQQQQQQQPQQLTIRPPMPSTTTAYQLLPQSYVHQPHIMNSGYESEERARNFHML